MQKFVITISHKIRSINKINKYTRHIRLRAEDFREKYYSNKLCVLILYKNLSETQLVLKIIERYIIKGVRSSAVG
jgi:hypothetical protein